MSFPRTSLERPGNRLLAQLPAESWAQLRPRMNKVELSLRQIVQEPDKPVSTVYFPESGWVSLLTNLEDGTTAEVGCIGYEGMVGVPVLLEGDYDELEGMVQGAGTAYAVSADALRAQLAADEALRGVLLRYALAHLTQVARTAACNARHTARQRVARWLLMAHDRARADSFVMTHEFLSIMLGIRRAGVSVAAAALQQAGIIRYERGSITIRDRGKLEHVACECYGVGVRTYERLCEAKEGEPWKRAS